MTPNQQAEINILKAKSEALRTAYEKLDDAVMTVRICIDPETDNDGYLASARETLTLRCQELNEAVEALASNGKK